MPAPITLGESAACPVIISPGKRTSGRNVIAVIIGRYSQAPHPSRRSTPSVAAAALGASTHDRLPRLAATWHHPGCFLRHWWRYLVAGWFGRGRVCILSPTTQGAAEGCWRSSIRSLRSDRLLNAKESTNVNGLYAWRLAPFSWIGTGLAVPLASAAYRSVGCAQRGIEYCSTYAHSGKRLAPLRSRFMPSR
jgi:hypothetical protein